jgi:iron complex outermembrane recepter protein
MMFNFEMAAVAAAVWCVCSPAALAQSQAGTQTVTITTEARGQSRQIESVSANELAQLPPGSSPLAAMARLPSVNFQSSDSFGAYEWSTRITVRGFNQNQLGFTLDDIPLGDMSYGNFNGLHISRAIATENISRSILSPGTGSLSTASSSNLGGTLQFYSRDPSKTRGVQATVGLGSNATRAVFARAETGDLGGFRASVSLTDNTSEKWKGNGERRQEQINLKAVAEFGKTKISGFVNSSKRREIDDQDLSLAMIRTLGYEADNTFPDFGRALAIATTQCGNTVGGVPSTYSDRCDYAYYAGSGLRDDTLMGVSVESALSANSKIKATVYDHENDGRGLWYTPYTASPNGTPISLRTTEYAIRRNGLVATADINLEGHSLKAGLWTERNNFNQARRFYSVSPTAIPSPYEFPSSPFFTQWQYAFKTDTTQFSLEDSVALNTQATLNFGFKSLEVKMNAQREIGDAASNPQGQITAKKSFLPQVGLTYSLSRSSELFAGYSQNMRAYQSARTGLSPFSTTQAGFNAIAGSLRPETSATFEAGWRWGASGMEAVVAGYVVNFKDRLLAIQQGPGIVGNPSVVANVGGARLAGVELSTSAALGQGFSIYTGVNLNKSEYSDNFTSNGVTFATKGKTIVDSPDTLVKAVLSYERGGLFGNVGIDHMGKRYFSYLNDASVPGRTLLNGSLGYRLGSVAGLKDFTVQMTGANLTDKRHVSTLGSNGFVTSGDSQTLLAGAPRSVFFSVSGKL